MSENTEALICFILFSQNTEAIICFILFSQLRTTEAIICFILFSHEHRIYNLFHIIFPPHRSYYLFHIIFPPIFRSFLWQLYDSRPILTVPMADKICLIKLFRSYGSYMIQSSDFFKINSKLKTN